MSLVGLVCSALSRLYRVGDTVRLSCDDAGALWTRRPPSPPRAVHLAPGPLPAAGAFTSNENYALPDGAAHVTFWVTYTRGASGGYPELHIVLGNGFETSNLVVIDSGISSSQQFGVQQAYCSSLYGPVPPTTQAISFAVPVRLHGGETTIRMVGAEKGVTATPGTLAIAVTAGF